MNNINLKRNISGYGFFETIILLLILGGLVFAGIYVAKSDDTNESKSTSAQTTESDNSPGQADIKPADNSLGDNRSEGYMPVIKEGWKIDSKNGINYALSPNWLIAIDGSSEVSVEEFNVDEGIHIGFGAAVEIRYNSSQQIWQELRPGSNNEYIPDDLDILRTASMVEDRLSTTYYENGDGPCTRMTVLFQLEDSVTRIDLPAICTDYNEVGADHALARTEILDFIKTITID